MTLEKAIETIEYALIQYCEDCISSEKEELYLVDLAWKTIKKETE